MSSSTFVGMFTSSDGLPAIVSAQAQIDNKCCHYELFTDGVPMVVAFGLSPWVLLVYELPDASVTLFSHSNIRVPASINRWLRYLIVTPDLHRVHHSVHQRETDSNFSAVFPVWDVIFGTFRTRTLEPQETMALGLDNCRGSETDNLRWLLVSPMSDLPESSAG